MNTIRILILTVVAALACAAAPILTLEPGSGNLTGEPGTLAGFGFTLTADPNEWISVVFSTLEFESNPDLGFYEDYIGMQGGPTDGSLAPGAPAWQQDADPDSMLGLGAFFFSPLATIGSSNQARLVVIYERFSGDPASCDVCRLGEGEFAFDVVFTAGTPGQEIPEPGTFSLLMLAGALGVFYGRTRRRRG